MDLAYSARNQELFFLETCFWRRRVWYVGKGKIGAAFVHPNRGLQCVRRRCNERSIWVVRHRPACRARSARIARRWAAAIRHLLAGGAAKHLILLEPRNQVGARHAGRATAFSWYFPGPGQFERNSSLSGSAPRPLSGSLLPASSCPATAPASGPARSWLTSIVAPPAHPRPGSRAHPVPSVAASETRGSTKCRCAAPPSCVKRRHFPGCGPSITSIPSGVLVIGPSYV